MATEIYGITSTQNQMLVAKFGWDSFPNGNSGYAKDLELLIWVEKHFEGKFEYRRGSPAVCRRIIFTSPIYITRSMLR